MLTLIHWLIERLRNHRGNGIAISLEFSVPLGSLTVGQSITITRAQEDRMKITLPNDKKFQITVGGKDKFGEPAPLENVSFTSADSTIASVDSAGLVSPAIGHTTSPLQITVTADSLIGPGEHPLTGLIEFDIIPSEAVTMDVGGSIV